MINQPIGQSVPVVLRPEGPSAIGIAVALLDVLEAGDALEVRVARLRGPDARPRGVEELEEPVRRRGRVLRRRAEAALVREDLREPRRVRPRLRDARRLARL